MKRKTTEYFLCVRMLLCGVFFSLYYYFFQFGLLISFLILINNSFDEIIHSIALLSLAIFDIQFLVFDIVVGVALSKYHFSCSCHFYGASFVYYCYCNFTQVVHVIPDGILNYLLNI